MGSYAENYTGCSSGDMPTVETPRHPKSPHSANSATKVVDGMAVLVLAAVAIALSCEFLTSFLIVGFGILEGNASLPFFFGAFVAYYLALIMLDERIKQLYSRRTGILSIGILVLSYAALQVIAELTADYWIICFMSFVGGLALIVIITQLLFHLSHIDREFGVVTRVLIVSVCLGCAVFALSIYLPSQIRLIVSILVLPIAFAIERHLSANTKHSFEIGATLGTLVPLSQQMYAVLFIYGFVLSFFGSIASSYPMEADSQLLVLFAFGIAFSLLPFSLLRKAGMPVFFLTFQKVMQPTTILLLLLAIFSPQVGRPILGLASLMLLELQAISNIIWLLKASRMWGIDARHYIARGRLLTVCGFLAGVIVSLCLAHFNVEQSLFPHACAVLIFAVALTNSILPSQNGTPIGEGAIVNFDEAPETEREIEVDAELEFAQRYDLTPREVEVFKLLVNGLQSKIIASTLFISPNTAKTHISNIYAKIGVHSQQELIMKYLSL